MVYVARRDAHALGQMGTMPVALWWGDREVRAAWGIDYFVSPDAEGQGHSIALAKAWMQGVDVALALGLAETSYLICRRLGFADLGFVPFYQAILDPARSPGSGTARWPAVSRRRSPWRCGSCGSGVRWRRTWRSAMPRTSVRTTTRCGRPRGPATTPACGAMPATCAGDTARRRTSMYAIVESRRRGVLTGLCRDTARGLQRAATGLDRRRVHRCRGMATAGMRC